MRHPILVRPTVPRYGGLVAQNDSPPLKRRTFLHGAASVALAAGCSSEDEAALSFEGSTYEVFLHGVASGDPLSDAVILWTRITRREATPEGPVAVRWRVARDPTFSDVIAEGEGTTDRDRDDTFKLDATGLDAGTTVYFDFEALEERSMIGRTRTAPSGATDRVRVALASCASFGHGYYNAYRKLAQRPDVDVVLHLGDYIYEYGDFAYGEVRTVDPPHETVTLEDYRRRYAHHRSDADLQEAHRQHPFVAVWDDHETTNNSWSGGAQNHSPDEGAWADRVAAATQAFFEWMPIRDAESRRVDRSLPFGDLMELIMLDTRLCCRDEPAESLDDPAVQDPMRSMLGAEQEGWLADRLTTTSAQWKLVGQQVMMAQAQGLPNPDQWDGYPFARQRFFDVLRDEGVDDVVVLTGDIHSSWGIDLAEDPYGGAYDAATGAGALAVEIVTPGITSPGVPPALAGIADGLKEDNPHMQYVELTRRGYTVLDVTPERVQVAWYHVDTIEEPSDGEELAAVYSVATGIPHLVEDTEVAAPPARPPLAP